MSVLGKLWLSCFRVMGKRRVRVTVMVRFRAKVGVMFRGVRVGLMEQGWGY